MTQQGKVKTLFIGSGTFAVEILKGVLSSSGIELVGVVAQPDKPAGRKKVLTPCPVTEYSTKSHLPNVFKPLKLEADAGQILEEAKPELVIVTDYGQIIPNLIINYPKYKCLNIHGSLLPDLRCAVPIPISILKGYKETGISIPIMTSKMDDGDVIAFQKEKIKSDDTTESLKERLAMIGAKLLLKTVPDWVAGKIKPTPQDESKATYTWQKDISKEKAQITPEIPAELAEKMVRAFYPWPIAWFYVSNKKFGKQIVKIFKARFIPEDQILHDVPGMAEIIKGNDGLLISLKGGGLELLEIQMEGKTKINAKNAQFLIHENILKTPL